MVIHLVSWHVRIWGGGGIQWLRHAKIAFFDPSPPPPYHLTFVQKNLLVLSHDQHKPPLPPPTTTFPIKNEILGFKKDKSRSKGISFLYHMFFSN